VATAQAANIEDWRRVIERQLGIEGFLWFTKEGLSGWTEGQFHASVCMEIVKDGRMYYVGTEGNDIKEAIMRELEVQSTGWSLWKDGRKVKEQCWTIDRYEWKSDDKSLTLTIDGQQMELSDRRNWKELKAWLEKEYPEEGIIRLSRRGKPIEFWKVEQGGVYWTISKEDSKPWKCLIDGREHWFAYRPSHMELSEIL
jgi:hypothetical protein